MSKTLAKITLQSGIVEHDFVFHGIGIDNKTARKERTDSAISHVTTARFCKLVNKWDALQPE